MDCDKSLSTEQRGRTPSRTESTGSQSPTASSGTLTPPRRPSSDPGSHILGFGHRNLSGTGRARAGTSRRPAEGRTRRHFRVRSVSPLSCCDGEELNRFRCLCDAHLQICSRSASDPRRVIQSARCEPQRSLSRCGVALPLWLQVRALMTLRIATRRTSKTSASSTRFTSSRLGCTGRWRRPARAT